MDTKLSKINPAVVLSSNKRCPSPIIIGITSLKDLSNLTRHILYSKKGVGAKTGKNTAKIPQFYAGGDKGL